jgi:RNA polymerase sigma factor (sigma-70 family)
VEPVVRLTLAKVLGPADQEFEELVQLSLERLVKSIVRGKQPGRCSLSSWTSAVSVRVCLDRLGRRRPKRRLFWFLREGAEKEQAAAVDVSHHASQKNESQRRGRALRRALLEIAPDRAEAVVLFEVMGHELDEIAELTNVTPVVARSRLAHGRKELVVVLRRILAETAHG